MCIICPTQHCDLYISAYSEHPTPNKRLQNVAALVENKGKSFSSKFCVTSSLFFFCFFSILVYEYLWACMNFLMCHDLMGFYFIILLYNVIVIVCCFFS